MVPHGRDKLLIVAIVIAGLCTQVIALDWDGCRAKITYELGNKSISLTNTTIFHPGSTIEAPYLTLPACEIYCGKGITWYPDIGPILNTWLIPVLILISQMDVSPLDKRTYLVIFHLLGDPIDSIYSLLLKIEAWNRCRIRAEWEWNARYLPASINRPRGETWNSRVSRRLRDFIRRTKLTLRGGPRGMIRRWRRIGNDNRAEFVRTFGTLLGGIEEVAGEGVDPYGIYHRISLVSRLNIDGFRVAVAYELANSRTDDMYRTCLAVVLFFYQVVSAFITRVGGNASSPPGGRIGISMFLTYILPAILLSNLLGNFTSASTCYGIFQKNLPAQTPLLSLIDPDNINYHGNTTEYFKARPWSGGIYTFRPEKKKFDNQLSGTRSLKFLFLLAILPVFISTSVGMAIIWHLPPAVLIAVGLFFLALAFSTSSALSSHIFPAAVASALENVGIGA